MYKNKLIGAILLNYNDYERTFTQLNKLNEFSLFDKIILVDNNSSDNDVKKLKQININNVDVIYNSTNKGYGAGNNVGLKSLYDDKFDYVLLINNDIIISKNSVVGCIDFLINHHDFCAATPKMIEKGKIKRNFYDIPTFWNTLNFISSTFSKKCKSMEIYNDYIQAEYVRESATIYDLKKFKEINFFDENIFMYEEGPSTGFMFKKLGYKEAVVTKIEPYIHNHKGPLINRKLFAINKKSRLYFFKNYHHYGKLKIFIFKIFWLNLLFN